MSSSVYLGVLDVIWVERGERVRAWTLMRESKGRRVGLEPFPPRPHRFQMPARLSAFRSQPASQPGFFSRVSLFAPIQSTGTKIIAFIFFYRRGGRAMFSSYLASSLLFVLGASKESNRMLRWFCSHTHTHKKLSRDIRRCACVNLRSHSMSFPRAPHLGCRMCYSCRSDAAIVILAAHDLLSLGKFGSHLARNRLSFSSWPGCSHPNYLDSHGDVFDGLDTHSASGGGS